MAWTKVTKPVAGVWSWVNPFGRTTYDDPLNPYDDSQDFFDTVNQAAWTNLAKPTPTTTLAIKAGMITGLAIPLTYTTNQTVTVNPWTKISKPI